MTFSITYPTRGRGAWSSSGLGGTINAAGTKPGSYYRAPATGSGLEMIGLRAFRAVRDGKPVDVNYYATFMAVKAYQAFFGSTPDGIWGPKTDQSVKSWQSANGLTADGVLGPKTSKAIFKPMAEKMAYDVNKTHPELKKMVVGHLGWESAWDAGAVGGSTPVDLGLGQINGPAHPNMSEQDRLTPSTALLWVAQFVNSNLVAFNYNVRDGVSAYNLGQGGTRSWIKDGRPDVWINGSGRTVEVKKYIDNVLALGV